MVFVSINYRVGPFGFLASQRVRDDGDLNVVLLDQRQALEWVQKHITKVSVILLISSHNIFIYLFISNFSLEAIQIALC